MEIKRFTGIRNTTSEERFRTGDLYSAVNVELDNTGKLLSRKGYTVVNPAAGLHSLYANQSVVLVAESSTLKRVENDYSLTTVGSLGSGNPVSYDTVVDDVFLSNGTVSKVLRGGALYQWGVEPPRGQPTASAVGGSLPAGVYQYAMTFVREDGHVSGTGVAGQVTLPSMGGIKFSDMEVSTNPAVRGKILWLSSANGTTMFLHAQVLNVDTTVTVTDGHGGVPLRTQFADVAPVGSIVRYHGGRMYVVCDDVVFYSDPYELELFRYETNFLRFPGKVAVFEPVNDGVFVATVDTVAEETSGGTWFLRGLDPDQFRPEQKFDYGAVPGTSLQVNAGDLESPNEGEVEGQQGGKAALWSSRAGVVAGYDGGAARNLTAAKYGLPAAQRGASMMRRARGYSTFVSALQGTTAADNVYDRG
jgi:hypothetical protein